jgi:hypothetical protein
MRPNGSWLRSRISKSQFVSNGRFAQSDKGLRLEPMGGSTRGWGPGLSTHGQYSQLAPYAGCSRVVQLSSAWRRALPTWALPTICYLPELAAQDGRMPATRVESKNGPHIRKDGIIERTDRGSSTSDSVRRRNPPAGPRSALALAIRDSHSRRRRNSYAGA